MADALNGHPEPSAGLYGFVFGRAVELSILYKRLFPRGRGQTLAHSFLKRRQPPAFVPGVVRREGRKWYISDLRNNSEEAIYYGVPQDPGVKEVLQTLVRPGDIVVDVGANIGYYTALFSELVGPKGRVYAFEASPVHFQTLERNLSLQGVSNVVPQQIAIADARGGRTHYTWPSSGSLVSDYSQYGMECILASPVDTAPLDQLLPAESMTRVRLIKVDVDGNEIEVIRGAARTITSAHPLIFLEVSERAQQLGGATAMDLLEAIEAMGYGFVLAPDQAPMAASEIAVEVKRTPIFLDVICVPRTTT